MYKHSADGGCSPAIIVTISDAPRSRTRVVGQPHSMFAVFLTASKLLLWWFEYFQTYNVIIIFSWTDWRFRLRQNSLSTVHTGGAENHGMGRISSISDGIYFERLRDSLMCWICSFAIKRLARCYNWYELSRKKEPVILRQCGIVPVISGIVDTDLGGVVDRSYLIRESV